MCNIILDRIERHLDRPGYTRLKDDLIKTRDAARAPRAFSREHLDPNTAPVVVGAACNPTARGKLGIDSRDESVCESGNADHDSYRIIPARWRADACATVLTPEEQWTQIRLAGRGWPSTVARYPAERYLVWKLRIGSCCTVAVAASSASDCAVALPGAAWQTVSIWRSVSGIGSLS